MYMYIHVHVYLWNTINLVHTNLFNSQCHSMESPLHAYPDIHVHVHTEVQHAKAYAQCHGPLIDLP